MGKLSMFIVSLGLLVVHGCASRTPYLDSRFGDAVNTAKALQTLNPEASRRPDPVTGIDGPSAKESIDRYRDSFKAPERTFEVITGGR